jgi:hypothetical protein
VDYGWDELAVRTSAEGSSTLLWVLPEMDPNRFYLITKTFEVQDGDWLTTSITESYTVEGALAQWPKVVVGLEKRYRIYLATLLRGP